MDAKERLLYHQVHPLKLAVDFSTAFASLALLWRHQLPLALCVMWVPSILVTLALVRKATFEPVRDSATGAQLRTRMTRTIEGLRFGGLGIAACGAWQHEPIAIALGFLVIGACWTWVLGPRKRTQ